MRRITVHSLLSVAGMVILFLGLFSHQSPAKEFSISTMKPSVMLVPVMLDPNPNYNNIRSDKSLLELSKIVNLTSTITINYLPPGPDPYDFGHNCTAWPVAAQATYAAAVNLWASKLTSTVPITIDACWADNLPSSPQGTVLGQSTPLYFVLDSTNTWYPIALANALKGTRINQGKSDMYSGYNSHISWYFGTDGNPPSNQLDFVTVIAHEIAHGLGFAGSMQVSSGQGFWGYQSGYPFIYDKFAVDGVGHSLLDTYIYPNPSVALGSKLTGESVFFNGANASAANGGSPVKLYAPSNWQNGLSYSHLDYNTYVNSPNALMIPFISSGRAIHDQGPVTMGLLRDLGWSNSTDSTPPAVAATVPTSGDSRVAVSSAVTATFSESMDSSTVSTSTFTLKNGSTPVAGSVNYNAATMTATLTPSAPLVANTTYTATITTGVKDISGNAMTSNKVWNFTTAAPGEYSTNILVDPGFENYSPSWMQYSSGNFELIYFDASFSHTGNGFAALGGYPYATERLVQNISIPANASKVSAQFWYWIVTDETGTTALDTLKLMVFNPTTGAPLKVLTTLSNTNQSSGYVQSAQYDLSDYKGQTVGVGFEAITNGTMDTYFLIDDVSVMVTSDTTPPTVTTVTPTNGATGVAVTSAVTASFSEAMNPSTITASTFTLKNGSISVAGTVNYNAATLTATFTPSAALSGDTLYTATITTGVKDLAGNPLAAPYSWSFITQPTQQTLVVTVSGSGTGTVTSSPAGISCTIGTCSALFASNSLVTLRATPSSNSLFNGWSGSCTNKIGDCVLMMNTARNVTASFVIMPPVRIVDTPNSYYLSLAEAISTVTTGGTIQAQATILTENVALRRAVSVFFKGGYNSSYSSVVDRTILHGKLMISQGRLTVKNLAIR